MTSNLNSNMFCGLKVDARSPDWHKTLTKVLKRIKVISYSINAEKGMALVTCRGNLNKLIRKLSREGKHADIFWVETGNHQNRYHYHLQVDYHQPVSGFQQGYHPVHDMTNYYPQRPQYGYGYGYDPHSYYLAWV